MNIQIVMEHLGVVEDDVLAMDVDQFARVLAYIKLSRAANDGLSTKEAVMAQRLGL